MDNDSTLKCRTCRTNAQATIDSETITRIRCLQCGIEVAGPRAEEMFQEHLRYIILKKAYDIVSRNIQPSRSGVTIKPGPKPVEPVWEFYVEIDDQ